jgi:cell division protein FtsI (penicillin-binding protein 3)
MSEPIDQHASRRLLWIGRLALVWAIVIVCQLFYLQFVKHEEYRAAAERQHHRTFRVIPDRGEILDRTGHPLAVSVRTSTVVINPLKVKNPGFFAGVVAPLLSLDPAEVEARILELQKRDEEAKQGGTGYSRGYYELKRHLTPEEEASLQNLRNLRPRPFDFIELHRDARREYPNGQTAAHVVGSVDRYNEGVSGVERKLDAELRGTRGMFRALTDSLSGKYFGRYERPASEGVDVTLTIHSVIQHEAEKYLEEGVEASGAQHGSVVVMDPGSGEILALANYPNFDPREEPPLDRAEEKRMLERRRNWAILAPFEPGSVMKMITVAMGIDTGRFTADSPINCENGAFPRPGRKAITDLGRYGTMPLSMVLVKSSNIGVTKVSLAVGPDTLWDYLKRFGFGQLTGIELPGESVGQFKPRFCTDKDGRISRIIDQTRCWGPASHEYISFGHEIGATAVQLARATAVIANGGHLVEPRLVLSKSRPLIGGGREPVPVLVREPERVIKPETSHVMRRIMERVVEEGTGRRARLEGYSAGGKTGSAEVWDGRVKRRDLNNASFIGFAPVDRPSVVVVVTLGRTPRQGGAAAAPIFRNVAQAALRILQVPGDLPDRVPAPVTPVVEEEQEIETFTRLALAEDAAPVEAVLEPVALQAGAEAAAEWTPLLAGPKVPDFRGKPVVAVMQESVRAGLEVEIIGRGRARAQRPAPGAILGPGERVRVEFRP